MRWHSVGLVLAGAMVVGAAAFGLARGSRVGRVELRQQVVQAEQAFAASMAARDFDAFTALLSREAVFMSPAGPQRGKDAVAQAWRAYFDKPAAPFSWEPDEVEVLASGTLAFSSGPVKDAAGKQVGRFNSVWRLEGPGTWRVVFDRGCDCGR
ncbi:MAG: nuclear transport factor 2 family protein [Telluria sp.]